MVIIQNIDETSFTLNGIKYVKNFISVKSGSAGVAIYNAYDTKFQLLESTPYSQIQLNGTVHSSQSALINALASILFAKIIGLSFISHINLSSTTPTQIGVYVPTQSGTYTNFGGIVVDLNAGYTSITFNGSTYGKQVNPVFDATKEPIISAGTTSQYWRGDKTWRTLNKTDVGLGNVDNTTDLAKPTSTATTASLNSLSGSIASINTIVGNITNNDVDDWVFPIVDSNQRLLGGWEKDGSFSVTKYKLNSLSATALKDNTLNVSKLDTETKSIIPTLLDDQNGYVYTVVDSAERFLFGVRKDGSFVPAKYNYTLPNNSITYNQLTPSLQTQVSFDTPKNNIICWGDSLTAGAGGGGGVTYVTTLQSLVGSGYTCVNRGIGGENVPTIAARQGGVPAIITSGFTLPVSSTTSVVISTDADVRIKNSLNGYAVKWLLQGSSTAVNPVTIQGIECTLTYSSTGGTYSINRNVSITGTSGTTIANNSPIYPVDVKTYRNPYSSVIFIGQNGGYANDAELIDYCKRMVEFVGSSRYIIIGVHSGTAASRAGLELAMFNAFGLRYINWRQYVSTYGLADAGLTPTQADLDAMAVGSCPPQLLVDSVHLTAIGYTLLGQQVFKRMKQLTYL